MMIDKSSNKIPSIKIDLVDDRTDEISNSFDAGHPRLGEIEKTTIRLKERKEFKVFIIFYYCFYLLFNLYYIIDV